MEKNKLILVVDDSFTTRSFVRSILEGEGYQVAEAVNGRAALDYIKNDKPDGMMLDLLMPEVDGFDVLEGLQADNISLPVVVATADIQEGVKREVFELGAKGFLNKPIKKERLVEVANRVFK